jgi:hypothetical protein
MIGYLYRYPHPHDLTKFIYCGQKTGKTDRDKQHRYGYVGFGKRFKKTFPGVELPRPIIEEVEVSSQLELNELETIWMFQYHTWRGYEGGMNLSFPGSADYKNMGEIIGPIRGRKNVESGQFASIKTFESCSKGGRISGQKSAESGTLARVRNLPQTKEGQRRAGRKAVESGSLLRAARLSGLKAVENGHQARISKLGACFRWNIRRGKSCVCGKHQLQIEDSCNQPSQIN